MPRRPFRIGRSITGLGLFAVRPIKRRESIVGYSGPWIDNDEADRREKRGARYLFEVNSLWTIDGTSRRNLGRYVNHSCKPNAEPVRRKRRMVFVALRAIAPGEEITFDYGKEYVDSYIKPSGCRCLACKAKAARRRAKAKRSRRAKTTRKANGRHM
jgi:uncharacterized protein